MRLQEQGILKFGILFALLFSCQVFAFPVHLSHAPENNLELTLSAIRNAKRSLLFNIYEFTEPRIADALIERIQAGVHVEILREGEPVGGISEAARAIEKRLIHAMTLSPADHRFFEMKTLSKTQKRRFRYNHAKYVVIDEESLLISSENYSPHGHPVPGTVGNRGWEILIDDTETAQSFRTLFSHDIDPSYGDVALLNPKDVSCLFCHWIVSKALIPFQFSHFSIADASEAQRMIAPETSLSGLLKMIRGARSSIDLEQMTFHMNWKDAGIRSPLFDALISAAERGVQVRVLLNDETAFLVPPLPNEFVDSEILARTNQNKVTAEALNQLAQDQHIPITARIANLRAMKVHIIHNKGALIDGKQTLISSINWNENSITRNRETAVLLTSPEVYDYFESVFQEDWKASDPR